MDLNWTAIGRSFFEVQNYQEASVSCTWGQEGSCLSMIQFDEGSISACPSPCLGRKNWMTPSPTWSSKLPPQTIHCIGEEAEDQGQTCGHWQHAQEWSLCLSLESLWVELCPSWQRLGGTEWIPQMNLQNLINKGNKFFKLPEKFYLELSFQNVIGRSYFVCFDGKSGKVQLKFKRKIGSG